MHGKAFTVEKKVLHTSCSSLTLCLHFYKSAAGNPSPGCRQTDLGACIGATAPGARHGVAVSCDERREANAVRPAVRNALADVLLQLQQSREPLLK